MKINNTFVHKDLMLKSLMAFSMQFILATFVRWERSSPTYMGSWELNATRIICAMILHMTVMPEVKCAL